MTEPEKTPLHALIQSTEGDAPLAHSIATELQNAMDKGMESGDREAQWMAFIIWPTMETIESIAKLERRVAALEAKS